MRETIGTVPPWEEPTAVIDEGYLGRVLNECLRFVVCLIRWAGPQPDGLTFEITENYHDDTGVFFYNMDVVYPDEDKECRLYAEMCRDHCPKRWHYYYISRTEYYKSRRKR